MTKDIDAQFTRETWRRSKKRATYVRVRPYSGRKTAPEAFLIAARAHAIGSPLDKRARCAGVRRNGLPCRSIAMNGSTFCLRHGGAQGARRFRAYVPVDWHGPARPAKGERP